MKKYGTLLFLIITTILLFGVGFSAWTIYYSIDDIFPGGSLVPDDVEEYDDYIKFVKEKSDRFIKYTRYGFVTNNNTHDITAYIDVKELKKLNEESVKITIDLEYSSEMTDYDDRYYDILKCIDDINVILNIDESITDVTVSSIVPAQAKIIININNISSLDLASIKLDISYNFKTDVDLEYFTNDLSPLLNEKFGFLSYATLAINLE
jgi:hypothetical protein